MSLSRFLQIGGIAGGVAIAFSVLLPLGGDPLRLTSTLIWTVIVVGSIALLWCGCYPPPHPTGRVRADATQQKARVSPVSVPHDLLELGDLPGQLVELPRDLAFTRRYLGGCTFARPVQEALSQCAGQ